MSAEYGVTRPKLDARLQGSDVFTATANSTTEHYYTFDFDCDFNGVEIYTHGSEIGHKVKLTTEYNAGLYGWKRYKKFGKSFNIFPKCLQKYILFPTKPSAGVRVHISYTNPESSDVKFAVNFFQFVQQESVDPSQLQEGTDW